MKKYLALFALILMQGCSSSDSNAPANNAFNLSGLQEDGTGTIYMTQPSGDDSDAIAYAGTLTTTKNKSEMLEGVLATPRELDIFYTDGGIGHRIQGTSYTDENNFLIRVVIPTYDLVCDTAFPDSVPSFVKIGDIGTLSTMTCDNNTTVERSWRVEGSDNANAKIIHNVTIKDQFNAVTNAADVTHTVASDGGLLAPLDKKPQKYDYCGGGSKQRSISDQISCTAFPAKLSPNSREGCGGAQVAELAGSNRAAGVWKANNSEDFWIIHGCDGAGLMNDGLGANFYVEQYYGGRPFSKTSHANCEAKQGPNACTKSNPQSEACWCPHTQSNFTHPGTGKHYKLNAGMWTYADNSKKDKGKWRWPDQAAGKRWWQNMKLPNITNLKVRASDKVTAFVVMYPWVCNGPWKDSDWGAFWGNNESYANGLPFGTQTNKINCYYDNEPWDSINKNIKGEPGYDPKHPSYDPHDKSKQPPPVWKAYKFVKRKSTDKYISGWMIGYKEKGDPGPVIIAKLRNKSSCNKSEGGQWSNAKKSCEPKEFKLYWKKSAPY
jgi:hypothetical protein